MSIVFSRCIGVARRIFLPFLLFILSLHSVGCKQDTKSGAGQLLVLMREAYEQADYSGVRILADSLHRHYTTDTVARREALSLSRQAEYKECERNRAFADSALLVLSGRIDSASRSFKISTMQDRSPEFFLPGFGEASGQEHTRLRCSADTLGSYCRCDGCDRCPPPLFLWQKPDRSAGEWYKPDAECKMSVPWQRVRSEPIARSAHPVAGWSAPAKR